MLAQKKSEIIFTSWSDNACSDSGLMYIVTCAKLNLFEVFHQHVNCIWCLHVWDTHQLARRFRRPADHSPLLLPPPTYRRRPRTHWPPSAWDVSNTALGVMSVQQLDAVNDSRWFPWSEETGERSHQQRQWQYPSGRHVVLWLPVDETTCCFQTYSL